jgi:hypothetical protein
MNENEMIEIASNQASAKPLGIVLVSIYTGINAALSVLAGIGFILLGFGTGDPLWMPILGAAIIGLGIVSFAATYGLWVIARWARVFTILVYGASISLDFISFIFDRTPGNSAYELIFLAVELWILFYLTRQKTKDMFLSSK